MQKRLMVLGPGEDLFLFFYQCSLFVCVPIGKDKVPSSVQNTNLYGYIGSTESTCPFLTQTSIGAQETRV